MKTLIKQKITTGVIVERDGEFWGIQYQDGHATVYGYGDIDNAEIGEEQYCKKGTLSFTYENSPHIKDLERGKLVRIEKMTVWRLI